MSDQEEDIKVTLSGGHEEIQKELEPMINYLINEKGNLYSYILTLDDETLENYADAYEIKDKKNMHICFSLSLIAYGYEIGEEFTATLEELMENGLAFSMMCGLASLEKKGLNKVTDKSKVWNPKGNITVELTDKFYRYTGCPLKE